MADQSVPRSSLSQPSPPPNDGNQLLNSERRSATPDGKLADHQSVEKVESTGSLSPVPRTKKQKRAGNIQYLALLFSLFMLGWNDGSTGPLLPRIQAVYGVRHTRLRLLDTCLTDPGNLRLAILWCLSTSCLPALYVCFSGSVKARLTTV